VTSLIAFGVIDATLRLGVVLGAALLLANTFGWRSVSATFDRERLLTGS
jgi:hypothetical protein